MPRDLVSALEAFELATDTKVVITNGMPADGTTARDGTLFVDVEAGVPILTVAAHEWLHQLRRDNPTLFNMLRDEVRRQGRLDAWKTELQRRITRDGGDASKLTDDLSSEELTADAVADALTDPQFLREFAARKPTVFRRVVDTFLKYLDRVISRFPNTGSSRYMTDVKAFRDVLADVLEQFQVDATAEARANGVDLVFSRSQRDASENGPIGIEVPTRFPTGKGFRGNVDNDTLLSDLASARQDPTYFNKIVAAVARHTGLSGRTVDDTAEVNIEFFKRNLLWLYDHAMERSQEAFEIATHWYTGGNKIAQEWASEWGVPRHAVTGMMAALSPSMDWFQNLEVARRVGHALTNLRDFAWTSSMREEAERQIAAKYEAGKQREGDAIRGVVEKTLNELSSAEEKAVWFDIYDRAENDTTYRMATPDGEFLGIATNNDGSPSGALKQSVVNIAKAVSMYENPTRENISRSLGLGHKVRNFFNNLESPGSLQGHTTIDTHAIGAAHLMAVSNKHPAVNDNFSGPGSSNLGLSGTYPLYHEAYIRAASDRGVLPREMQSITWEAVRTMFEKKSQMIKDARGKSTGVKYSEAIERVWENWRDGQFDEESARRQVSEITGGVRAPDWFTPDMVGGSNPEGDGGSRLADNSGAVPQLGVQRRQSGGSASRGSRQRAGDPSPVRSRRQDGRDSRGVIDEATGLPLNADGTVTVYHHTSKAAAEAIRQSGRLKAAAEPDVYVTTRSQPDTGYGDVSVSIDVDPSRLSIDDEFPDGRRDFRLSVGRPGGSIDVRVSDQSDELLFSRRQDDQPVFYSQALRAVEEAKGAPKSARAEPWKQWLDGAVRRGDMKQSERDWLGLDQWLDSQPGAITRQMVADFVRANEVRVDEVTLGKQASRPDRLPDNIALKQDKWGFWSAVYVGGVNDGKSAVLGPLQSAEEVLDKWYETGDYEVVPEGARTKFSNYRIPGGKNYREMLLTLPQKSETRKKKRDRLNERWNRIIGDRAISELSPAERAEVDRLEAEFDALGYDGETLGDDFQSSHWGQPNVLAHVRFDERIDADGKRVLFLNEIQSDWHQAGRKSGYRSTNAAKPYQVFNARTAQTISEHATEAEAERAAESLGPDFDWELGNTTVGKDSTVPDAPFKATDDWAMLAFKRMARYAADNGFDRIAWTTGEMAADLFGLSKQVDSIAVRPVNPRSVTISIPNQNALQLKVETDGKISAAVGPGFSSHIGKGLDQIIGKEMAEKVMSATDSTTFTGDGLKVGGAGMRGFYDKILPAAVSKWAKKFGAKVGTALLPEFGKGRSSDGMTDAELLGALKEPAGGNAVHGIDITPQMQDAVSEGQPLFSRRQDDQTQTPEFRRWFGDSKVVDEDGKPLVVYHGTTSSFESFVVPEDAQPWNKGIFFSSDSRVAGDVYAASGGLAIANEDAINIAINKMSKADIIAFAKENTYQWSRVDPLYDLRDDIRNDEEVSILRDSLRSALIYNTDELEGLDQESLKLAGKITSAPIGARRGANVVPAYLSLQNPLVIDAKRESFDPDQQAAWIEEAKDGGNDGLIIKRYEDGGIGPGDRYTSGGIHDVYVAFRPEQIKSATGNSGAFDPENPSILLSRRQDNDDGRLVEVEIQTADGKQVIRIDPEPLLAQAQQRVENLNRLLRCLQR